MRWDEGKLKIRTKKLNKFKCKIKGEIQGHDFTTSTLHQECLPRRLLGAFAKRKTDY